MTRPTFNGSTLHRFNAATRYRPNFNLATLRKKGTQECMPSSKGDSSPMELRAVRGVRLKAQSLWLDAIGNVKSTVFLSLSTTILSADKHKQSPPVGEQQA